jgi:hypothetical protein
MINVVSITSFFGKGMNTSWILKQHAAQARSGWIFYHAVRCGLQRLESRGLVAAKPESRVKISRFCWKVALSDRKVGCENGVFAPKFHTQEPNRGPKSLRDSELGFWGCAKRRALLEAQPPPPYAPRGLSDFPQAEYVKTLYRLPCVGALTGSVSHRRSMAYTYKK